MFYISLIEAALSEMVPHAADPELGPDIAFLRASVLVLKGELAAARRSLLAAVHSQVPQRFCRGSVYEMVGQTK